MNKEKAKCETCKGSGEKLISGMCNMIHKYITYPDCKGTGKQPQPSAGELTKELDEYHKNHEGNISLKDVELFVRISRQACMKVDDQAQTIAERDEEIKERQKWLERYQTKIVEQTEEIKGMKETIAYAIDGIDALLPNWPEEVQKDMLAIKQTLKGE